MSGHSKWANIKRQKAVVDAKKGAVYARMSREIIVAARLGADPAGNFRLRQAIERARAEGLPNDNIQRAIEKGSGAGASDNLEELVYEGYGPGGVAIMVRCTTDNRNRTAGDLRYNFSKHGGNLGETGCVGWMFKERGELKIIRTASVNEDELLLAALDAGASDIDTSEDQDVLIVCEPNLTEKIQHVLQNAGYQVSLAEVAMSPGTIVEISDPGTARKLVNLLSAIEDLEDVQQVYSNFDMDSKLLQTIIA